MTTQSEIERRRKNVQGLLRKIGTASNNVATARAKAAKAMQSAQRSSNSSTIQSKLREAQREEDRAVKAESERAKLEKKLAAEQKRLHQGEAKLALEHNKAQERAMSELEATISSSSRQFFPEFETPVAAEALPTKSDTQERRFDVFLSHASEDKEELATPLAEALKNAGLEVWFDEFELQVGDSLRRKIDEGLANSSFGVVLLSPHFFAKDWPQAELDGLTAKATANGQTGILPIWHHLSKDEVLAYSPTLAGLMALNSSNMTVEEMAAALVKRVRSSQM